MIKKSFYETPEAELIEVRFEEAFLQGTGRTVTTTSEDRPGYEFEEL